MSIPEDPPNPPESFQTKEEAIFWMLNANSEKHKEARTKKSEKIRVYFRCTKPECEYTCHIRKSSDNLFRVVEWKWHTCGDFSQPKVKRAGSPRRRSNCCAREKRQDPLSFSKTSNRVSVLMLTSTLQEGLLRTRGRSSMTMKLHSTNCRACSKL